MYKTYQTDHSFFTILVPKMCNYYAWPIYEWLFKEDKSKFRLIQDIEIEENHSVLKEVNDIYPGIKTIGVVMNPYARIIYKLNKILEDDQSTLSITDRVIRNTFESRVVDPLFKKTIMELDDTGYTSLSSPSAVLLPQLHWLSYEDEQGYHQSEYIVRGEYIEQDLQPLADYFCLDKIEVNMYADNIDYRPYYTDEIYNMVTKLYELDIKTFGYEF